jgi:hypothetical protein
LLFSLFDPVPRAPRLEESGEDMPQ